MNYFSINLFLDHVKINLVLKYIVLTFENELFESLKNSTHYS